MQTEQRIINAREKASIREKELSKLKARIEGKYVEKIYDKRKIAELIKKERKSYGLTKGEFAFLLNVNRNTITAWECGDDKGRIPPLEDMLRMCNLFECELGYLLCEEGYDECKTRAQTDFQDVTGLSKGAIEKLFRFRTREKGVNSSSTLDLHINAIIENDNFIVLLEAIQRHVENFNREHYTIHKEDPEVIRSLSDTFNCETDDLRGYIEITSQSLIESLIMKIVEDIK